MIDDQRLRARVCDRCSRLRKRRKRHIVQRSMRDDDQAVSVDLRFEWRKDKFVQPV